MTRSHPRPHFLRRSGYAALALIMGASLLVAACDDGDDGGDDPTVTSTATMTSTAAETSTAMATATEAMATATEAMATGTSEGSDAMGDGVTVELQEEGDLAPFLVDSEGMTLYIFTNDEPGVSNCEDTCLENWPPLTVEDGEEPEAGEGVDGELAVIDRDDGTRQVTYNDQPLYYFQGDSAAGDTNGHEVGGVWFVAEPDSGG